MGYIEDDVSFAKSKAIEVSKKVMELHPPKLKAGEVYIKCLHCNGLVVHNKKETKPYEDFIGYCSHCEGTPIRDYDDLLKRSFKKLPTEE